MGLFKRIKELLFRSSNAEEDFYENNIFRKLEEEDRQRTKSLKFNFKKEKNDSGYYDLSRDYVKKDNVLENNNYLPSKSWKEEFVGWNNKKKKQDGDESSGLFNMFD